MNELSLPQRAEVVIIGGGVIGASVAFHLSQLGMQDVVLLEQGELSCGTTWHAVGLVGQLRHTKELTQLIQYSTELYSRLESETGLSAGWKPVGSVMVARTDERMESLRRMASMADGFGVEAELVSAKAIGEMWAVSRIDDLRGGVWLPGDGTVNPTDVTQSLARGARRRGVRICEGVRVLSLDVVNGSVKVVRTSHGNIDCDLVVNCAGQWARQVGRMAGVTVPLYSVEHMYIVSEAVEGVSRNIPVLRDPDGGIYIREEIGGLIVGGFEPEAKPWIEDIPADFSFQLLEEDWDQFGVLMDNAIHRIPPLEVAGIKKFYNGPESFTPDNQFIMGEAPEVRNMFVAAGFNSVGIATAGGVGMALAHWIVDGEQPFDLWPVDIRRFSKFHGNVNWLRTRVREAVGHMYEMPWPNRQFHSGRMLRRSPIHHLLTDHRASFGEVMGWECADWFAPQGAELRTEYSFGKQNWFPYVGAEYRTVKETVGICDWSSLGKFLIRGEEASRCMEVLCANDVNGPEGSVVRTPLLNEGGGYESDVFVIRRSADEYLLVTGTGQSTRDFSYLKRHLEEGRFRARIVDVTTAFGIIGIVGPKASGALSSLVDRKVIERSLAGGSAVETELGWADAMVVFSSVLGVPAWMCWVPVENTAYAYENLLAAASEVGGMPVGRYALESLRQEAGHALWGRDLTVRDTPLEAGYSSLLKLETGIQFRGRQALMEQREGGIRRRLVSVALDDSETMIWGDEPVLRDGHQIGHITSAAYGYGPSKCIGMAFIESDEGAIDREYLKKGPYHVDLAGRWCEVSLHLVEA